MRTLISKRTVLTAGCSALLLLSFHESAQAQSAARCGSLAGFKIAATEIGLPSGGATISTAQMQTVPADPKLPGATREFCNVMGAIAPVDPNAPPVNFEVNLPLQWNGKAVQYGGAGFNGTLVTGLGPLNSPREDAPFPLSRGFATWGTDSGHDERQLSEVQAFALNEEALTNFAYAAYKKTHDVDRRIASEFYGRPPSRNYYFGQSEGGREALAMAQRFPSDFDGIVSVVPVINWTGLLSSSNRSGVVQQNGGWLNPRKVAKLHDAVLAVCDLMDGLADGIVGMYEKCVGVFDPKTLRCPGGPDTDDSCLSDAQILAVEALHRPFEFGFAVANGVTAYPGWNYGGENQPAGMVRDVTGSRPPVFPPLPSEVQSRHWSYGSGAIRYFIARDASFNSLAFQPPQFVDRVRQISALMDTTNPDLSAFMARGGKVILKEHGSDFSQSPFAGIEYYQSVVGKIGQENVDSFLRFYVAPGASHGGAGVDRMGKAIPRGIDLLSVLDAWVERGEVPETLELVSQEDKPPFRVLSSRPMCRYPLYPRYNGRGDPKQASNFTCAKQ